MVDVDEVDVAEVVDAEVADTVADDESGERVIDGDSGAVSGRGVAIVVVGPLGLEGNVGAEAAVVRGATEGAGAVTAARDAEVSGDARVDGLASRTTEPGSDRDRGRLCRCRRRVGRADPQAPGPVIREPDDHPADEHETEQPGASPRSGRRWCARRIRGRTEARASSIDGGSPAAR